MKSLRKKLQGIMCLLNHGKWNVHLKNKPFTKINEITFLERALALDEWKVTREDVTKPRPGFPSTFSRLWGCFSSSRRKKAKHRGVYSSVSLSHHILTLGHCPGSCWWCSPDEGKPADASLSHCLHLGTVMMSLGTGEHIQRRMAY